MILKKPLITKDSQALKIDEILKKEENKFSDILIKDNFFNLVANNIIYENKIEEKFEIKEIIQSQTNNIIKPQNILKNYNLNDLISNSNISRNN